MRNIVLALVIVAMALGAGCGKGKNKDQESFRIPDSLLAPIEGYGLTVDEYHPVNGGIMANAQIELHYPASEVARYISVKAFGYLKSGYEVVSKEIGRPAEGKLVVIGTKDLDEYLLMTRKEWWYYGVVKGDTIIFEPLDIMIKRSIIECGATNRIAQAAISRRSGGRAPAWLKEAVAVEVANERPILDIQMPEWERDGSWNMNPSPEAIDEAIADGSDRGRSRIAYHAAHRMLQKLLVNHSMDNVLSFFDRLREGKSLEEASAEAFGIGYRALIDKVRIDGGSGDGSGA